MPNTTTAPRQLLTAETLDIQRRIRQSEDTYRGEKSQQEAKVACARMLARLPLELQRARAALPSYTRRRPCDREIRTLDDVQRVGIQKPRHRGGDKRTVYAVCYSDTPIQVWDIMFEAYVISMDQDGALYFGRKYAVECDEVIQGNHFSVLYWVPAELDDIVYMLSTISLMSREMFLEDLLYGLSVVQHPYLARAKKLVREGVENVRFDIKEFARRYRL